MSKSPDQHIPVTATDTADTGADPWDAPWPRAPVAPDFAPASWQSGEAVQFRALLAAAEPLARFHERLRGAPRGLAERIALLSVAALLRDEGLWIGPERIALFRELRLGGPEDARNLARAAWAMRRLMRADPDPLADLRAFLGRVTVQAPERLGEDRPVGDEIDSLARGIGAEVAALAGCHDLTRAAFAHARWRAEGLTPWEDRLEPAIAVLCIAGGGAAPGLPMAPGARLDAHATATGPDAVAARLAAFYDAARAGALAGLMELDRMARWQDAARAAIEGRSGRTPPLVIEALMRWPVVSADLLATSARCTPMSARRNLAVFAERGLIREITGQDRYRFWTAAA